MEVDSLKFSKKFEEVLDLLDDCVMIVDKDGKMVFYNRASEELDNLSREDVVGRHFVECFNLDKYTSLTLKTLRKKQAHINVYQDYVTMSNNNINSVSSSYPLLNKGELVGAVTVTKDITKFKKVLDIFNRHHIKEVSDDSCIPRYTFDKIIGTSTCLKKCIDIGMKASETDSPVLIYGETGTGKELFAQSIYNQNGAKGEFVSLNCAAIPENLLEGLLFGTSRGAFTGSIDHPGLFEEASNGTLFLDELNSMSLNLQSKLLRAIETGRIRRVGETKERCVKPRIISAVNMPPLEAIEKGILRRDLFYRLGVVTLNLPSLKERKEDIPELVDYFIKVYNKSFNKKVKGVTPEVMELFMDYNWPGNIRELQHAIECAMNLIGNKTTIQNDDLPFIILEYQNNYAKENIEESAATIMESLSDDLNNKGLKNLLEDVEQKIIDEALHKAKGNVAAAAKKLGLNRQSLDYKIKKYQLD